MQEDDLATGVFKNKTWIIPNFFKRKQALLGILF